MRTVSGIAFKGQRCYVIISLCILYKTKNVCGGVCGAYAPARYAELFQGESGHCIVYKKAPRIELPLKKLELISETVLADSLIFISQEAESIWNRSHPFQVLFDSLFIVILDIFSFFSYSYNK